MTEWWTEGEEQAAASRGMTEEEELLAAQLYRAVQAASHTSERSEQSKTFVLGISELGTCQERTRRLLAGVPEQEGDKLEAFIGTAIGEHVERAIVAAYPDVVTQATVSVTLQGDGGEYTLTGHPDLVHPWGVGDVKTSDGLEIARRNGPSRQQWWQRNLYLLGAHQAGLLDCELADAKTYNVWFDRSGRTKETYVHLAPFDPMAVTDATIWLDEVVYNYRQGTEAMKEPPRPWCEKVCGHYADCRMYDTDVTGLITDPDIVTAVQLHQEGLTMEKAGKRMKEEGQRQLDGITGYVLVGDKRFQIRHTWVNGTSVAFERKGYDRLSITKVK